MFVGNFTSSTFPNELKERIELFYKNQQADTAYAYKVDQQFDVHVAFKGGCWVMRNDVPSVDIAKLQIIPDHPAIRNIVKSAFTSLKNNIGTIHATTSDLQGNKVTKHYELELNYYSNQKDLEKANEEIDRFRSVHRVNNSDQPLYFAVKSMCLIS